jgi:hypothetical protein
MANVLVVDVANVMGSRPDGWWRDRAGAATRLLGELVPVIGRSVSLPGEAASETVMVHRAIAVLEGQARSADVPERAIAVGLEVLQAVNDGDSSVVAAAQGVLGGGHLPIVVTADRGLRERLPAGSMVAGPGWLLGLL